MSYKVGVKKFIIIGNLRLAAMHCNVYLVAEKLEGDDRATSSKISPVATSNLFWTEQEMCLEIKGI